MMFITEGGLVRMFQNIEDIPNQLMTIRKGGSLCLDTDFGGIEQQIDFANRKLVCRYDKHLVQMFCFSSLFPQPALFP